MVGLSVVAGFIGFEVIFVDFFADFGVGAPGGDVLVGRDVGADFGGIADFEIVVKFEWGFLASGDPP